MNKYNYTVNLIFSTIYHKVKIHVLKSISDQVNFYSNLPDRSQHNTNTRLTYKRLQTSPIPPIARRLMSRWIRLRYVSSQLPQA